MTKTRSPGGLPPLFFRKTAKEKCKTLNTMFKAVKWSTKLENLVTELCENDRVAYQKELLATRDTNLLFKHVKRLSKSATIPKVMSYAARTCKTNTSTQSSLLKKIFVLKMSIRNIPLSQIFPFAKQRLLKFWQRCD